jgi:hypothetical protein
MLRDGSTWTRSESYTRCLRARVSVCPGLPCEPETVASRCGRARRADCSKGRCLPRPGHEEIMSWTSSIPVVPVWTSTRKPSSPVCAATVAKVPLAKKHGPLAPRPARYWNWPTARGHPDQGGRPGDGWHSCRLRQPLGPAQHFERTEIKGTVPLRPGDCSLYFRTLFAAVA